MDLQNEFPGILAKWTRVVPEDVEGAKLLEAFTESGEPSMRAFAERLFAGKIAASAKRPVNRQGRFHVHVYANSNDPGWGPHAKPQRVEELTAEQLGARRAEFEALAATGRSILIHEDTKDDLHDHLYGATWLGPRLPLDLAKLDF